MLSFGVWHFEFGLRQTSAFEVSMFFASLRIKFLSAFYNDLNYSLALSKYALEIKLFIFLQ